MNAAAYPVLRSDSADYETPDRYSVQLQQTGAKLEVKHQLSDAHCLPVQLLRSGLANLCCEVRMPHMLYSHRFVEAQAALRVPEGGQWEHQQQFPLPETGDKNLYFLPGIVLRDAYEVVLDSNEHGVSSLWHGRKVHFPKGAILAGGTVYEDLEKVFRIIRFEMSDSPRGSGRVQAEADPQGDNWQFVVRISPELYDVLGDPNHRDWEEAFYIGCFAQMLNVIRSDFKDTELPPYDAVRGLGDMLRDQAGVDPPWETDPDDEGWRDTLHLATTLRGLRVPGLEENGA